MMTPLLFLSRLCTCLTFFVGQQKHAHARPARSLSAFVAMHTKERYGRRPHCRRTFKFSKKKLFPSIAATLPQHVLTARQTHSMISDFLKEVDQSTVRLVVFFSKIPCVRCLLKPFINGVLHDGNVNLDFDLSKVRRKRSKMFRSTAGLDSLHLFLQ